MGKSRIYGLFVGGLPRIRKFQADKNITCELVELEKVMSTYNACHDSRYLLQEEK